MDQAGTCSRPSSLGTAGLIGWPTDWPAKRVYSHDCSPHRQAELGESGGVHPDGRRCRKCPGAQYIATTLRDEGSRKMTLALVSPIRRE
jgi:hypothetical protein